MLDLKIGHHQKRSKSLTDSSELDVKKRFGFDWEIFDVIVSGQSAIDSATRLRIRTVDQAVHFMNCYGYDLENPIEKAELFGNFQESLSFIRRFFLAPNNPEGLKIEIPRKIAELTDITQLLMLASAEASADTNPAQTLTTLWSCAIIKVMHTIAHMDKDLRTNYFKDIQTQIFDRFYKHIHTDSNGQLYLGKEEKDIARVDLIAFESKPKKGRDSVLLKLLHKSENVAEDIFDRVGIRFVTKNKLDALRVIKYLKDRYVLMPANIKPSRSRNNLVDLKEFSKELERVLKSAETINDQKSVAKIEKKLNDYLEKHTLLANKDDNPHSSKSYRAIQFTCRQLIKIKNPLYDDLKIIKSAKLPEELTKVAERLDLRNLQKEIRFFYPYEVQLFDEKTHLENLAGESSHTNYKKGQVQTALKRVMGELSRFSEK